MRFSRGEFIRQEENPSLAIEIALTDSQSRPAAAGESLRRQALRFSRGEFIRQEESHHPVC